MKILHPNNSVHVWSIRLPWTTFFLYKIAYLQRKCFILADLCSKMAIISRIDRKGSPGECVTAFPWCHQSCKHDSYHWIHWLAHVFLTCHLFLHENNWLESENMEIWLFWLKSMRTDHCLLCWAPDTAWPAKRTAALSSPVSEGLTRIDLATPGWIGQRFSRW